MILPLQEMLTLVGQSHSYELEFLHQGVEKAIKTYCRWEIEQAIYTNRLLGGSGIRSLHLNLLNVTALTKVSAGLIPAINIKHSTASSNAYAKVNYTDRVGVSLGLVVSDGADISDTTDLFSTYSTLTLLVAQIASNGWSAQLDDSDFGAFASTNLIETQNEFAGTWDGTDPGWTDLFMPSQPLRDFELDAENGILHRDAGWSSGVKNIPVTCTAGWTTATMPADLKHAVAQMVQFFHTKESQGISTGISEFDLGHLRIRYNEEMTESGSSNIPVEVLDVLDAKYKVGSLL